MTRLRAARRQTAMRKRTLVASLLLLGGTFPTPGSAQVAPPRLQAQSASAEARLEAMTARLSTGLDSGAVSRAEGDVAAASLANVRARRDDLARRDQGLNAADRQFLSNWLDEIAIFYPFLANPGAMDSRHAVVPPPLATTTPGALVCSSRDRVLLAVGRDRASAAVQRSMDVDVTLIAEAVGAPYAATDALSLHVRGPGLDARVDGARAGPLLFAGSTSNFALKAGRTAHLSAEVAGSGDMPRYVRIWGVCRAS